MIVASPEGPPFRYGLAISPSVDVRIKVLHALDNGVPVSDFRQDAVHFGVAQGFPVVLPMHVATEERSTVCHGFIADAGRSVKDHVTSIAGKHDTAKVFQGRSGVNQAGRNCTILGKTLCKRHSCGRTLRRERPFPESTMLSRGQNISALKSTAVVMTDSAESRKLIYFSVPASAGVRLS